MVGISQLSEAVVVNVTVMLLLPYGAVTVMLDGQVIVGASVSLMVTVCVADAVLPEASVTIHVTVVIPFGKVDGALLEYVDPGQLSDIDGVPSVTCAAMRLQTPGSVL